MRLAERVPAPRGAVLPAHRPIPPAPLPRLIDELVEPVVRMRAEIEAAKWGVQPLEAALALGLVTPEAIAARLAERLGARTSSLQGRVDVAADPADWQAVLARRAVGIDRPVGGRAILIAPGAAAAERLASGEARVGSGLLPLLVATPQAYADVVRRWARQPWMREAVEALARDRPDLSASDRRLMTRTANIAAVGMTGVFLALGVGPSWLAASVGGAIGLLVLAWMVVRLAAAMMAPKALPRRPLTEADLPRYTILCPLYREEKVAATLLTALARLDYPRALLDIKLVLETGDGETLAAIRSAPPVPMVEVIVVPADGPRTKPKALMAALPFATGELVVVFDAEDRPHPGQLREAAETFAAADPSLVCLQAPLTIVSTRDGWLSKLFAAEYDALFRVLLPAFARLGLPMPLGGTSNHFRREALVAAGGWDPFNVTEDADLGLRLARDGWRVGTISSPTYEEAPTTFGNWLGQRSRWFKGWLQTTAVLLRRPRRLVREIGPGGLVVLLATLVGSLGSALVHLICLAAFGVTVLLHGLPPWFGAALTVLVAGYVGSIAYKATGLLRSGRPDLMPWLILLPLGWLVMGLAGVKAVLDLASRPFHWEKTQHGDAHWPEEHDAVQPTGPPPQAVVRIIALTEAALATGRHDPRTLATTLRRHCARLRGAGTAAHLLTCLDAYVIDLEMRGRSA